MKNNYLFLLIVVLLALYDRVSGVEMERVESLPIAQQASYFSLSEVRLLDSPFKELQQKGKEYLLWLHPDSLLHFYRIEAGLPTKAKPYAGWESQDVWGAGPLRGGFLGFYLSSLSMMYQSTGDKELLNRLRYTIKELDACQQAGKDGFLLGVKEGRKLFSDVASGKIETNNPTVNGSWAPVYLINKMMLGLSAAYVQCGQKEALPILIRLGDWFGHEVLDKLTNDQIQKLLVCEHGSINESFLEVYELTGEKRFLEWAHCLNDRAMWEPLSQGEDILFGWHANTQIPKFTGFLKYYTHTGDERFAVAARNFWDITTRNHTWVIGGNSTGEHFFPKEEFEKRLLLTGGPETCNSVNMLRLTEALFCNRPVTKMAAYYERVLFNHILSAYDPVQGMCCYFTSMRPGHYRIYASRDSSFWCCGHTGLESPAKLGKFIYSHQGKDVMVNLFIPSTLTWKEGGIELIQQNRIPESDQTVFTLSVERKQRFALRIRKPEWTDNATFLINGEKVIPLVDAAGYWVIDREWKCQNTIALCMPMNVYTESLIGSEKYVALLYGPYVLAGRMGGEKLPEVFWSTMNNAAGNETDITQVPCFAAPIDSISSSVQPITKAPLKFGVQRNGFEGIVIEPFYRIHFERYSVYWPVSDKE